MKASRSFLRTPSSFLSSPWNEILFCSCNYWTCKEIDSFLEKFNLCLTIRTVSVVVMIGLGFALILRTGICDRFQQVNESLTFCCRTGSFSDLTLRLHQFVPYEGSRNQLLCINSVCSYKTLPCCFFIYLQTNLCYVGVGEAAVFSHSASLFDFCLEVWSFICR